MRRAVVASAAAVLLAGCVDAVEEVSPLADSRRFFNLSEWAALQDSLLAGRGLEKTVVVNGLRESRRLDAVDWSEELAPFAQSDIDRPALWDRYDVDSVATQGGGAVVVYEALDDDLFTRRLEVATDARGGVTRLAIDNAFESFVADTEQRLEWTPGAYRVYSRQDARLADARELEIEGRWE